MKKVLQAQVEKEEKKLRSKFRQRQALSKKAHHTLTMCVVNVWIRCDTRVLLPSNGLLQQPR